MSKLILQVALVVFGLVFCICYIYLKKSKHMKSARMLGLFCVAFYVFSMIIGFIWTPENIDSLLNWPAMVIVFGGTLGATLLQFPPAIFLRAIKISVWIFKPKKTQLNRQIAKMVDWSALARKEGLLGLETIIDGEKDAFAKKGLQLLVDGNEPEVIRDCLEVELNTQEHMDFQASKVYEAMGGYSPTIGIIGAVMGLIHVMQNLSDPSMLGSGIATAFVATIYGVGLANLFFLPIANKLKSNVYIPPLLEIQINFR